MASVACIQSACRQFLFRRGLIISRSGRRFYLLYSTTPYKYIRRRRKQYTYTRLGITRFESRKGMNGGRREEAEKEAVDEVASRKYFEKVIVGTVEVRGKEKKKKIVTYGENWDLNRNQVALVSTRAQEKIIGVIMNEFPVRDNVFSEIIKRSSEIRFLLFIQRFQTLFSLKGKTLFAE